MTWAGKINQRYRACIAVSMLEIEKKTRTHTKSHGKIVQVINISCLPFYLFKKISHWFNKLNLLLTIL